MRAVSAILGLILAAFCWQAARAYDGPGVLFILDGSGSMWGKLDDRTKIDIAKELMADLMDELPPDVAAGLAAYGHREREDCEDIEILAEIAPGNRDVIKAEIGALVPKGKTPITRAISMAGDRARGKEDKTTLVLISDGEETCNADPCALVSQLIEQQLNLQVHVVGFDVEAAEREQLECIAAAGKGEYFSADSADELGQALAEVKRVVVEEPPAAAPATPGEVTFIAVDREGSSVPGDVEWTLINTETEDVHMISDRGAELVLPLPPGTYEVFVVAGDATGEGEFAVTDSGQRFELALDIQRDALPFDAPASAPAGSVLRFGWRGPNAPGDLIFIAEPPAPHNQYPFSNRHETAKGASAVLTVPARPGQYEIRYFSKGNGTVLHRQPIQITEPEVVIQSPASLPAGTPFQLSWSGPDSGGDLLFIIGKNADHNQYLLSNNLASSKGSGWLVAPASAGDYEIRYFSKANATALFRQPLEVTAPQVSLDAPRTVSPGSRVTVEWTGPNAGGDLLFIAETGLEHNRYPLSTGHPTKRGSPAVLTAPAKAGTYEIRYFSKFNGTVLDKRALIVR